jgi:pentatricopeptide repeat protein
MVAGVSASGAARQQLRALLDAGHINAFCSLLSTLPEFSRLGAATGSAAASSIPVRSSQSKRPSSTPPPLERADGTLHVGGGATSSSTSAPSAGMVSLHYPHPATASSAASAVFMRQQHVAAAASPPLSDDIAQLVVQATRRGLSGAQEPLTPASLSTLAFAASAQRQWMRTLRLYSQLVRVGRPPAPVAVAQQLRERNVQVVLDWCRRHHAPLDTVAGIRSLGTQGAWSAALSLARVAERRHRGLGERYSMGVLVPYLSHGGQWETAARHVEQSLSQGALVDTELLKHIVLSVAEPPTWVACLALTAALARCQALSHVADPEVYRAIVGVCDTWQACLGALQLARTAGVPLDAFMYGAAIDHLQQAGQWETARDVALEAARMHGTGHTATDVVSTISPTIEPTADTVSSEASDANLTHSGGRFVAAFRNEAREAASLRATSWMGGADVAAAATGLVTATELCADAASWVQAARVGAQLLALNVGAPRANTYASLMTAMSTAGRWVEAIGVFDRMAADPNVVAVSSAPTIQLLRSLADAGEWSPALTCFARMRRAEPRVLVPVEAYDATTCAALAGAQWRAAIQLLLLRHRGGFALSETQKRLGLQVAATFLPYAPSAAQWGLALRFLASMVPAQRRPADVALVQAHAQKLPPDAGAAIAKALKRR